MDSGKLTIITPVGHRLGAQIREAVERSELLSFLVWRDIKVRYKQTALGAAWAVVQPLTAMAIFTVVFGRLAKLDSDGVPYACFAYAGLVPWLYFATGVTQSSNSLVDNERIISKVYFPRLLLPVSPLVSGLLDVAISSVLLMAIVLANGIDLNLQLMLAPVFIAFAFVLALGVGALLSALNTQFRDVRYVLPFLVQVWMYSSPVVYSHTTVPERWQTLYSINPMVTVIAGFRWSVLGTEAPELTGVATSIGVTVALVAAGLSYFGRSESLFADVV